MDLGGINYDDIDKVLKSEGLSKYDRKAYLTLLMNPYLSQVQVAEKSAGVIDKEAIPQPKIYGSLKSLSKIGLIGRTVDKKSYYAKDPSLIFNKKIERLGELKEVLKEMYQTGQEIGKIREEASIEELVDEDKVMDRVIDIVSVSKENIDIICGDFSWLELKKSSVLIEDIATAIKNGAKVRIIGDLSRFYKHGNKESIANFKELEDKVELRQLSLDTTKKNHVKLIVCDGCYSIIITPVNSNVIESKKIDYVGQFMESREVAFFYNILFGNLFSSLKKPNRKIKRT